MSESTIWAVIDGQGRWYPCDHMLLDDAIVRDSKNAKPFYGSEGHHFATLFARNRKGGRVVAHPHPEIWARAQSLHAQEESRS